MRPLDLADQRFGYVVAKNPMEERQGTSIIWECLCDCGNTCYFSAKQLKEVKSKSCGCEPVSWIKNLRGQIFGQLEVLEITDKRRKHGQGAHVVWRCMCHACGNECELSSRTLLINDATTCGCRGLKEGDRALNNLIGSYEKWARSKNVPWGLTRNQAKKLFKSDCHYCGAEPANVAKSKTYEKDGKMVYKEEYIYNGLDEVNPGDGYTLDNVVPCCKKCNEVKQAMTLKEFEEYILRLYNHYYKNGGRYITYNLSNLEDIDFSKTRQGHAPFNQVYSDYRRHATNKGFDFKLTKPQAKKLLESNCHYCGIEPSNLCNPKNCIGSFKYSGLDAIDNQKDYTPENVFPSCFKCNASKKAMSLSEWEDYIYRLYNHYFVENKRAPK